MVRMIVAVLIAIFAFLAIKTPPGAQQQDQQQQQSGGQSSGTTFSGPSLQALGNPTQATSDGRDPDNFLLSNQYFALSYNSSHGTPNWVSWHIGPENLGDAERQQRFNPDSRLLPGMKKVVHEDYNSSGFDRGHMCPHADRDISTESSSATFIMTNIIPQSPEVNQHAWESLEAYCRGLVTQGKELYVVAGPSGIGGTGSKGPAQVIGKSKVTVPKYCWKVVMVLDNAPGNDIERADAQTRIISIIMPNQPGVGTHWEPFAVSLGEVEQLTGYEFFDQVPEEIRARWKTRIDGGSSTTKPPKVARTKSPKTTTR